MLRVKLSISSAPAPPKGAVAPGPSAGAVLRGLVLGRRRSSLEAHVENWRRYGDVVRIKLGPLAIYLLVHPDHVREVVTRHKDNFYKGRAYDRVRQMIGQGLVTSEGALWQRQRRIMQPRFSHTAVARFGGIMTGCAEDMLAGWSGQARSGVPIRVDEEMMRLTMRIIGRTMLSVDLGAEMADLGRAIGFALDYMNVRSGSPFALPAAAPTGANRRFRAAMRTLDSFVYGLIEQRRTQLEGESAPDDLVTLLLQARDPETGEGLDDRQIRDEVLTIFFAGHETTALVLTWAWYLLASHPKAEQKLHAELAQALGGRTPGVDDLPGLPYTLHPHGGRGGDAPLSTGLGYPPQRGLG